METKPKAASETARRIQMRVKWLSGFIRMLRSTGESGAREQEDDFWLLTAVNLQLGDSRA